MNCNNCEQTIKNCWSYCPSCGTKTKPRIIEGMTLEDVFSNITNDLKTVFLTRKSLENEKILVKIRNPHNSQIQKTMIKIKQTQLKKIRKIPQNIREPKTEILENKPEKFKVKIHLPEIISQNTIEFVFFEESLELRAHAKNKMFFKIIKIPANLKLRTKTLRKEQLTLTFSL